MKSEISISSFMTRIVMDTNFVERINSPQISDDVKNVCESDFSLKEMKAVLFALPNNKWCGKDGIL